MTKIRRCSGAKLAITLLAVRCQGKQLVFPPNGAVIKTVSEETPLRLTGQMRLSSTDEAGVADCTGGLTSSLVPRAM